MSLVPTFAPSKTDSFLDGSSSTSTIKKSDENQAGFDQELKSAQQKSEQSHDKRDTHPEKESDRAQSSQSSEKVDRRKVSTAEENTQDSATANKAVLDITEQSDSDFIVQFQSVDSKSLLQQEKTTRNTTENKKDADALSKTEFSAAAENIMTESESLPEEHIETDSEDLLVKKFSVDTSDVEITTQTNDAEQTNEIEDKHVLSQESTEPGALQLVDAPQEPGIAATAQQQSVSSEQHEKGFQQSEPDAETADPDLVLSSQAQLEKKQTVSSTNVQQASVQNNEILAQPQSFESEISVKDLEVSSAKAGQLSGTSQISESQSTAKAVEMSVPKPVTSSEWGEKVFERIRWMANSSQQKAEIRLDPPDLGPLKVEVNIKNDHAQVTMTSHSSVVREILDQHLPRLREVLESQGFQSVDAQTRDGRQESSSQTSENGQGGQKGKALTDDIDEPMQEMMISVEKTGKGRVDCYI